MPPAVSSVLILAVDHAFLPSQMKPWCSFYPPLQIFYAPIILLLKKKVIGTINEKAVKDV